MADKKRKMESPESLNRLVLGAKIVGDITVKSCLRLDGEIIGNVKCDEKLVLGEEGKVVGDVFATEMEVNGKVEGVIRVENILVLTQSALVKGDIFTPRLVIEDGAKIEGNIQTGDNSNFKVNASKDESLETSDIIY